MRGNWQMRNDADPTFMGLKGVDILLVGKCDGCHGDVVRAIESS
jgi:hypothetical protein